MGTVWDKFLGWLGLITTDPAKFLSVTNDFVWGWPLIILLFGTHVYLTIRLRVIQRYLGTAIKLSFERKSEGKGDISHFGALMTALAATIGTGNIYGVAGAVAAGGPGAVLWMWLTGVFGIATKYSEAVLSVKYRVQMPDGRFAGGPMYVLARGMNMKWLGILFAIFTALAAFGIGNTVQANTIAHLMEKVTHGGINKYATGIFLTVLTGVVILGGVKWIARVCEFLVPVMAVGYILGCLVILALTFNTLWDSILLIITSAFSPRAAVGGAVGYAIKETIRSGIARGLFSNESGLGSAPIVAAAAQSKNPVRQALVSSTGTFWDTVVVCLLTGLVVVNSGMWLEVHDKKDLTFAAFSQIPYLGQPILVFGLLTFVFSTILGWSYYGERAAEYLVGPRIITPYRILWVIAVYIGSTVDMQMVWDFADITNALMAIPNLISLLVLTPVILTETQRYLWLGSIDSDETDRHLVS